jgi:hypothetical protein
MFHPSAVSLPAGGRKNIMRNRIRNAAITAALTALAAPAGAAIIAAGAGQGATTDWAGVGQVGTTHGYYGTGTLIGSRYVLTAAHLVEGVVASQARFMVNGVSYAASSIAINPNYVGNDDFDVAVITLTNDVVGVPYYRYNNVGLDELTAGPGIKVGYGLGGDGATGANAALYPYGTRRAGVNSIDAVTTSETFVTDGLGNQAYVPAGMLLYDFDNYVAQTAGPLGGLALGVEEIDTTEGDSGGPMFQYSAALGQYVITGITIGGTDDSSRFGDVATDLRVASYAGWIDAQVPEPAAATGALAAGTALAWRRRRRRK